jgi:hypothetical protein
MGDEGYWTIHARDLIQKGELDQGSNFRQGPAGAPLSTLALALAGKAAGGISFRVARGVPALFACMILVLGLFYYFRMHRDYLAGTIFLGLYGLFPLTVFYSRITHLEQMVLFFLFLTFILLERASSNRSFTVAGSIASIAVLTKMVAVAAFPGMFLYIVARHRKAALAPVTCFVAGAIPLLTLYSGYIIYNYEFLRPTFEMLASYHAHRGSFINAFSIRYFWLSHLTKSYLPFILGGLLCLLAPARSKVLQHWSSLWFVSAICALSIWRYQTYARHMLVFFPLLHITALSISNAVRRMVPSPLRGRGPEITGILLILTASLTTLDIGAQPIFSPRYTHREAARFLAQITDSSDVVIGPHNAALGVYGRYRSRMRINREAWREIDPLKVNKPTILLEPIVYNGLKVEDDIFPRISQFRYFETLGTLHYLNRFTMKVHRIFESADELAAFQRFRQGRASAYDGVLYNQFRNAVHEGCLVKGLMVAESRGDKEISHKEISTTGCAGMLGFCYTTATAYPQFRNLVEGIKPDNVDPQVFSRDDRFDSKRSIAAARVMISNLEHHFKNLPDGLKFAYASYNGGGGFIGSMIEKSGKELPAWESDILPLLFAEHTENYVYYRKWTREKREHKLRTEIPQYVVDAFTTYNACMDDRRKDRLELPLFPASSPRPE